MILLSIHITHSYHTHLIVLIIPILIYFSTIIQIFYDFFLNYIND